MRIWIKFSRVIKGKTTSTAMEHVNFVKLTDAYNSSVECDESRNYFFEDDGTCKLCVKKDARTPKTRVFADNVMRIRIMSCRVMANLKNLSLVQKVLL